MASVFRALTRPPLLVGVPVAPALLSFFALFMSGLLVSKFIWFLIPLVHVLMKRKANKDEQLIAFIMSTLSVVRIMMGWTFRSLLNL